MTNVTCYGTGVIGSAWGAVFLKGGCKVTFYDISQEMLEDAKARLKHAMDFFVSQELITKEHLDGLLANASFILDPAAAVKDADFIQENCPENLDLKRKVLKTIETYCRPDAIIASSSSGLMPTDIAADALHPERFIVGHPYNPVYVIPLVEICKGEKTSDETVKAVKEFYTSIGKKTAVLKKEVPGYICNRIQAAVLRECFDLVDSGAASVEDVDNAVTYSLALRWAIMGPHLVSHLGGGKTGFKGINTRLAPAMTSWLKDLASWTEYPEGYLDKAQAGIKEEMAHRAPGTGQTQEELGDYLNNGVMAILKYHAQRDRL